MTCPSCAAAVPEAARFCPACGHAVAGRGDERRVATVLFADLAGFTGLAEARDPEHVKNLVDRCFARLAADVTDHGGRVDKVVGDAIVALFGAPVAHEDDAERAVRTGLAMQRTVASLAAELGVAIRLRVGVNTGEVLVGAMRAGGDYTAMGDAVNVASRLQTMAEPATVVVGPLTHAATASLFRYEPIGELRARGREATVYAWRAIEALSIPGRRPRRSEVPLIGRDDELIVLRQSAGMAIRRAHAVAMFVLGDAGMGKSRLIEETAGWAAAEHGALVLEGRCVPYGEANPWWPLAEAVRRACHVSPTDSQADTGAKVRAAVARICGIEDGSADSDQVSAGLLHLMGDEDALPDVDPLRARQQARRSLHALMTGLTARQPVVLVLSELHWADDVVLELFGYHLDRLASRRLVVLAGARGELLERWQPPAGRYNQLTLHLQPLDRDAARNLAAALGADAIPAPVVDAIVARSGGNPFFLEELLTYVGEGESGRPDSELPATLHGLVSARIDALADDERSVLDDAAVIGRSGTLRTLRALAGQHGVSDVDAAVNRLLERDLLSTTAERWEFRSDVVREVAYGTLTKTERARRHWAVGSWLEEVGARTGRSEEMLEPVAHHYATAAEMILAVGPVPPVPADASERAVDALARAAAWASRRELPGTAVRLLDRAVALSPPGDRRRAGLLLERAMERVELRDAGRAREDLDAAGATSGELAARRLTVLGALQQVEGDLDASAHTLGRAVEEWRRSGDRGGEADALRRAGSTAMLAGRPEEAEAAFRQALDIARATASKRDEAWSLWRLAELSFYAGRRADTERRLAAARQAFTAAGDSGGLGWVDGLLGYLRYVEGDRAAAEKLALSVLDELRDRDDKWAIGMELLLLASIHLWEGRTRRAVTEASDAQAAFSAINDGQGHARAASVRARALAAIGQAADARAELDAVLERMPNAPKVDVEAATSWLALDLGHPEPVLEVAASYGSLMFDTEVETARGLGLLQCGRPAEARRVLTAATAAAETGGPGANGPPGAESPPVGLPANTLAVLALAHAACADPTAALGAAARANGLVPAATYRDRALADMAEAFACRARDDPDAAGAAASRAALALSGTEDELFAAVIDLGSAHLEQGRRPGPDGRAPDGTVPDGASERLARARDRLEELGCGPGWDVLFSSLLTAVPGR